MLDLLNPTKRVNPNYTDFEAFVAQLPNCEPHWKYPDAIAFSKRLCEKNGYHYETMKRKLVDRGYAVFGEDYYNGVHFLDKTGRWEKIHSKKNDCYCKPVYLTKKCRDLSREVFRRLKGEKRIRQVKHKQHYGLQPITDYHIVRRENIKVDVQELQKLLIHSNKEIVRDHAQLILDRTVNGHFEMMYYQNRTNRYTAIGQTLQTVCREVREAALKGKWSYDIDASQPCILNQIDPDPVIEDFLNRKTEIRKALGKACGLSKNDTKSAIMAVQYGASLKLNKNFALHRKFGEKTVNKLRNNEFIQQWKEVWSRERDLSGYMGSLIKQRNLSWVLQRIEVQILECIMDKYEIECLMHDGWTSEQRLDVEEMQEHIYQSTGFRVKINEEKL